MHLPGKAIWIGARVVLAVGDIRRECATVHRLTQSVLALVVRPGQHLIRNRPLTAGMSTTQMPRGRRAATFARMPHKNRRLFDAIEAGEVSTVRAILDQDPAVIEAWGDENRYRRDKTPPM
jgi:hypothetical protein